MQLCMHGHTAHCTELKEWDFKIIKNVSSSTSHKKTPSLRLSVCLSENLRKFFLTLSLIKIYMSTNIMNTQIFFFK